MRLVRFLLRGLLRPKGPDLPPFRAEPPARPDAHPRVLVNLPDPPARDWRPSPPPPPRPVPSDVPAPPAIARPRVLKGPCYVIDGDTIVIDRQHIRLAGIDAPELDHPYGQKSKFALLRLCKGHVVTAHVTGELSYGRYVAACTLPDGTDLAAELVREGLAVDWPKYSGGRYRHLEPPGIRKRLWRCDARQKGRMPPQDFGARSR